MRKNNLVIFNSITPMAKAVSTENIWQN